MYILLIDLDAHSTKPFSRQMSLDHHGCNFYSGLRRARVASANPATFIIHL